MRKRFAGEVFTVLHWVDLARMCSGQTLRINLDPACIMQTAGPDRSFRVRRTLQSKSVSSNLLLASAGFHALVDEE